MRRLLIAAASCFALTSLTACHPDNPAVEYEMGQAAGEPMDPATPAVISGSFSIATSDLAGDPAFLFPAPGTSVDVYLVVLDVLSPTGSSLAQIREMSGSRGGRVVFHAASRPGGDLTGTYDLNTANNTARLDYTYAGNHYVADVAITNILRVNRTAYVNATLTSVNADPCAADREPPAISLELTTARLWPANHQMVRVATGISATDNAGAAPTLTVTVSSNEGANGSGDGNTATDSQVVDNGDGTFDVLVRAERAGNGNGRVYTITATATDACSNATTSTATVTVPKSQR